MLWRLPKWAYNETIGRALNKRTQDAEIADLVGEEETNEANGEETLKSAVLPSQGAEARKRRAKPKSR